MALPPRPSAGWPGLPRTCSEALGSNAFPHPPQLAGCKNAGTDLERQTHTQKDTGMYLSLPTNPLRAIFAPRTGGVGTPRHTFNQEEYEVSSIRTVSRAPSRRLLAIAGLSSMLVFSLGGCSMNPSDTLKGPADGPSPHPIASPGANSIASPVALSAVLAAPTRGGMPPTVVGLASPVATAPAPSPSGGAMLSAAVQISITADRRFDPAQVTINQGETVQWVNDGRAPQTVTADPVRAQNPANVVLPADAQPWDSGVLNSSQIFTRTFDTPGTYQYVSLPDEGQGMVGQITVKS